MPFSQVVRNQWCRVSLGTLCALIIGILLAAISAVVLGSSLAFTLGAADEIARRFSHTLEVAALATVDDVVRTAVMRDVALSQAARTGAIPVLAAPWSNQSERTIAASAMALRMAANFRELDFRALLVAVAFADGSFVGCELSDHRGASRRYDCTTIDAANAVNAVNATHRHTRVVDFHDETLLAAHNGASQYDARQEPWYRLAAATNATAASIEIDHVFREPVASFEGSLYLASGALLGVAVVEVSLGILSAQLAAIPGTANEIKLLVDGRGLLLAASDLSPVFAFLPSTGGALPPGLTACTITNASHVVCRYSAQTSPSAAVRRVARQARER